MANTPEKRSNRGEDDDYEPSRIQRIGWKAQDYWHARPSLIEVTCIWIPSAVTVLGLGVTIVDDTLELEIARAAASIEIQPDDSFLKEYGKNILIQIGETALQLEGDR